jgi:hypothetical protein
VAKHTLGPAAMPPIQQHLEPVSNEQGIVREVDWGEIKDGAEWERHLHEQEAGKVVREVRPAESEKTREAKPGKTAERGRHRD